MHALKTLCLAATLAALSVPAWAALTYAGSGSYNLGSSAGPGGTAAGTSNCGSLQPFSGTDALEFNGSGINNIGIHAYSCFDSGFISFGSRSSGENTYYAQGVASVSGLLSIADPGDTFSFFINPGEVGAFGSTAFSSGEFQKASLTIQLVITDAAGTSVTYLDEAWSAEVGENGSITKSHESNGTRSVSSNFNTGSGYYSYGIAGGGYDIDLGPGDYNISYVMTSIASGNVLTTGICTAYLQGNKNQEGVAARVAEGPEGPPTGEAFTSYCGAGARSGDPFPGGGEPIARAQAVELPEPMTVGLTLTALLAAAGVRRRNKR
ncbi:PEP-CTERM sorting domain-containing protein [Roseateles sp. P5_E7]